MLKRVWNAFCFYLGLRVNDPQPDPPASSNQMQTSNYSIFKSQTEAFDDDISELADDEYREIRKSTRKKIQSQISQLNSQIFSKKYNKLGIILKK